METHTQLSYLSRLRFVTGTGTGWLLLSAATCGPNTAATTG